MSEPEAPIKLAVPGVVDAYVGSAVQAQAPLSPSVGASPRPVTRLSQ